ncbi:MAG TPA: hypothetical protein VLA82_13490 [Actinomycetota bacterium]|nr:hypothetical protein [Actinomycetota bacterium]
MRLTWKDGVATALLAAILIPYGGYLVRGEMPFIQDPRGMAATGIVGLVLSFAAWGVGFHTTFGKVMAIVGAAAIGIGIAAALIGAEGSEVLLAVFVGAIVLVWALETGSHAGLFRRFTHAR